MKAILFVLMTVLGLSAQASNYGVCRDRLVSQANDCHYRNCSDDFDNKFKDLNDYNACATRCASISSEIAVLQACGPAPKAGNASKDAIAACCNNLNAGLMEILNCHSEPHVYGCN